MVKLLLVRFLGSSEAAEFSSIVVLMLIIFFAGFCSKVLVMTGWVGQGGIETWHQVWVVNWDHLIYGSILVGGYSIIGWMTTNIRSITGLFSTVNPGGDKMDSLSEAIIIVVIIVVIIVIGLGGALTWIYDEVKLYTTALLKHAVRTILGVKAAPVRYNAPQI